MYSDDVDSLCKLADKLWGERLQLHELWQEIADNFYPQRQGFTYNRDMGSEFAEHLMTSFPLIVQRDTSNQISSMLRPKDKNWFEAANNDYEKISIYGKRWLEYATQVQRRAMYDPVAQFTRATRETDWDFMAFGQGVVSTQLNRDRTALLFRNWHLKDVVWMENDEGKIDIIFRKWEPTIRELLRLFGESALDTRTKQRKEKPNGEFEKVCCLHAVVPSEMYNDKKFARFPYVSIHIDKDTKHVMRAEGSWTKIYTIPRFQTVSGSQYAHSPATIAGLADARLLQAITRVLLEAGEKATNPPMIGVQEMIRSDVSIYAGGITWVEQDYEGRGHDVLRPLNIDKSGLPLGMELQNQIMEMLKSAFYLDKLQLPPVDTGSMTAYEVSQRVSEYIRQVLPIFEPVEMEYNAPLCEDSFELLLRNGAFGRLDEIPRELGGADIQFKFETPLNDAIDKDKANIFRESSQLLVEAMQLDPTLPAEIDIREAFRDSVAGIGAPATWMRPEDEAKAIIQAQQQRAQMQQTMNALAESAEVTNQAAQAEKAVNEATA